MQFEKLHARKQPSQRVQLGVMKSKCRQTNRDGRSTGHSIPPIPHSRRSAKEVFFSEPFVEQRFQGRECAGPQQQVVVGGKGLTKDAVSPLSASESEMFALTLKSVRGRMRVHRAKHVGTRVLCAVPPPRARGSFSPIDRRIARKRCTESRP